MSDTEESSLTAVEKSDVEERLIELDAIKDEDLTVDQIVEYLKLCGLVFKGPEEADEYTMLKMVGIERTRRKGGIDEDYFKRKLTEDDIYDMKAEAGQPEESLIKMNIEDFVEFYIKTMNMRTDAHRDYKEAMALYLISTLAMWKFKLLDMRELSVYDESLDYLPLNCWFMFIGRSRLARKSTVVNIGKKILDGITDERLVTNTRIKPKQSYQVNALLPDSFTPEALVGCLQDRCWEYFSGAGSIGERTHATWVNDEVSSFWSKLAKQDYMSGTPEILAKIYDCPRYYKASTQRRGQESVRYPYLTICTASTEVLPKFFDEIQLRQGFLNRYFFIMDKKRKMERSKLVNFDKRMNSIRTWLTALYNVKAPITMIVLPKVQDKIDKFEEGINDLIMNTDLGIEEGYVSNLPNYLRKLAGLFRISRISYDKLEHYRSHPDTLGIEMEDYDRGMKTLNSIRKDFTKVLELSRVKYYQRPVWTHESEMIKVWSTISEIYIQNKNKWVSKTQIIRKTRMSGEDLARTLNDLYLGKYLDRKEKKTKGAPKNLYKPIERPRFD